MPTLSKADQKVAHRKHVSRRGGGAATLFFLPHSFNPPATDHPPPTIVGKSGNLGTQFLPFFGQTSEKYSRFGKVLLFWILSFFKITKMAQKIKTLWEIWRILPNRSEKTSGNPAPRQNHFFQLLASSPHLCSSGKWWKNLWSFNNHQPFRGNEATKVDPPASHIWFFLPEADWIEGSYVLKGNWFRKVLGPSLLAIDKQ